MTHLHRHIRFTVELSFEARTDSLAIGPDLQGMLAHVAQQTLTTLRPEDLQDQITLISDRPAHIAPFVRRRHHRLVEQRRSKGGHAASAKIAQEAAQRRRPLHSPQAAPTGLDPTATVDGATHSTHSTQDRPVPRRSSRRSSTTPRRRSA